MRTVLCFGCLVNEHTVDDCPHEPKVAEVSTFSLRAAGERCPEALEGQAVNDFIEAALGLMQDPEFRERLWQNALRVLEEDA